MPNDRRFSSIARKGMSNEPDRQAVFGGGGSTVWINGLWACDAIVFVYRMWGGSVVIVEIATGLKELRS